VGSSRINSLASSGFTEPNAPSSEPQWRATLPAVFQAATPSADLNYSLPAIAINRRPVTSRALLQAPHNASCVFTERANKSAYHLQPNINCVGISPRQENLRSNFKLSVLTWATRFIHFPSRLCWISSILKCICQEYIPHSHFHHQSIVRTRNMTLTSLELH
jgi:hypothetical protein